MRTIVDLHMHSHFSRATSRALTIPGIAAGAVRKGIDVIATGDITHPRWIEEMSRDLTEDGSGFLTMKDGSSPTRFVLCGEVSTIYKKGGKARRVHTLFALPSLDAVRTVNKRLQDGGYNITSDGRPIIGMDVKELAKIYLDADPRALVIPAHIWTPWFSVFGSKSGFNTIEECFEEMSDQIFAVETGLSSDPTMNWRVSNLNRLTIISNSDAHSPEKIGREATVYDWKERTYDTLRNSLRTREGLQSTIEFFPEEGKYHMDGHRSCGVRQDPVQTKKTKGLCPKCNLPLVVGVLNRVEELADQESSQSPSSKIPFRHAVPLCELVGNALDNGVSTKKVKTECDKLVNALGSEFHILLDAKQEEINAVAHPAVAEGIRRVRQDQLHIEPGFDGVFGTVEVFTPEERLQFQPSQKQLFA